ncbi:hypothetical protein ACROYT_G001710 [Oculina patagonica]
MMLKSCAVVLVMLLASSLADDQSSRNQRDKFVSGGGKLVFYKFFTPMKLASAATFIHHHNSITPRLLTFLSAPSNFYRLMIVPLIPPGVIDTNANLVVKMAVGLETTFGSADSDPSFGVSDGQRYIGVITHDKTNYNTDAPCRGFEGSSGTTLNDQQLDGSLPKPSEIQYYPGRFEIQLSLSDRWGTCFVPLDGGFSREMVYQNKLNPLNGLFLEIYGNHAQEKEGIKYIEMNILQEN